MQRISKSLSILSLLFVMGCAHPGPLLETCLLNTSDKDHPVNWRAQCELKLPPDPLNPSNKSVDRKLTDMDKYFCTPPDDMKALLEWAHHR